LFDKLVNSNFDKNLTWLLDDITSLLARTSVAQVFQDEKRDPSIHFYEDFLDAYDPQVRKDQGVYYTPDEVVSYIVRTAHASLQNDFGLPLGLADTTTWAAFAKAKKLAVPEGVDPKAPFVQVLDPALGTGTFLLRVIEVIHETMQAEFKKQGLDDEAARKAWVSYVRKDLLPRINGFELMMAPYIVSHLRLGLALQETGFTFTKNDRLRVFLTNSLSPAVPTQLDLVSPHIAEEAKIAASIKLGSGISVVLGNPPYSGHSANNSITEIVELVHEYRRDIPELSRPGQGKWLQDDYVKFFRFAEVMLARVPCGVLGFITNNRYLVNRTFRGMRAHILATFEKIDVLDLHGDAKRGDADENVFQIQQGVAIGVFVRRTGPLSTGATAVRSMHLRGPARTPEAGGKLDMLARSKAANWSWRSFKPAEPYWLFEPEDVDVGAEYRSFASLEAIFSPGGRPAPGIVTTHDEFAVSFTEAEAVEKVSWLLQTKSEMQARQRFRLCTQSQWSYERAKQELPRSGWRRKIVKLQYRPFDYRFTVWDSNVAVHLRHRVMHHVLDHDNVALCTVRGCEIQRGFEHVLVSNIPIQHHTVSTKEVNYFLPLYLYPDDESQHPPGGSGGSRVVNIDKDVLASLEAATGKKVAMARAGAGHILPEDVFGYIYAILFSASYRAKYRDFLRQDYPRVPTRPGTFLFEQLAELGRALVDAHLLKFKRGKVEAFESGGPGVTLVGPSSAPVRNIGKTLARTAQGAGEVLLNDEARFTGIAERAWNLHLGGTQVLRKWLMDRKGRSLSAQEVEHYCLMVRAADCTAGIVERIDKAIGDAGGWPAAFSDAATPTTDASSKSGKEDDE
jgi:predicted helicase